MSRGLLARRREWRGIGFVAPAVLVMGLLIVYPIVSVVYLSLVGQRADGSTGFAGLANYRDIVESHLFPLIARNTAIWTVTTVAFSFVLGLGAALVLNQPFVKGKGVWRSLLLLPWITPGVVTASTWKWLYSADFGMWNHTLKTLGLIRQPISWLSDPKLVLGSVSLVQIWGGFPFVMLMVCAGLQAIPQELFEAARLDGARGVDEIRYVTLPALSNVIFIALLIEIVWSLNAFTLIWVMTQGGPASKSRILSLFIYDGFRAFNFNAAAAASVFQLIVSLAFAVTYVYRVRREG